MYICAQASHHSEYLTLYTIFPLIEAGSQIQAGYLMQAGGFYQRKLYGICDVPSKNITHIVFACEYNMCYILRWNVY